MGFLVHQWVGAVWWTIWRSDVLILREKMSWHSDVLFLFPTRWPYQGLGPLDWRRGFADVILVLMQMWEPSCDVMCSEVYLGTAWTKITLAACSRGFLAMKRTKTWCHWRPWMQSTLWWCIGICQSGWLIMYYLVCCDGNPCVLFSSVWPV